MALLVLGMWKSDNLQVCKQRALNHFCCYVLIGSRKKVLERLLCILLIILDVCGAYLL